jgi:hypothetical protein
MQITFRCGGMSSETAEKLTSHLKSRERFFIPNYHFILLTPSQEGKAFPINL